MPVTTSDGQYHESEFDYWHSHMFGQPQPQEEDKESKITLVRHGDTDLNKDGLDLVHGWVDTPLNQEGIAQAHKDAEALKDKEVDQIVSSDLPRAKQTANIISKATGAPVTFDPNLRTWDSGDYDFTNKHDEFNSFAKPEKENETPAGSSESFSDFKARVIPTLASYAADNQGHTVIVTHSKPIGVWNGWEHAGYPDDLSIHMPTYEEARKDSPGGRQPLEVPDHIQLAMADRQEFPPVNRMKNSEMELGIGGPRASVQGGTYTRTPKGTIAQNLNKELRDKLPPEKLEKELQSGKSAEELAGEYGVSHMSIRRLADRYQLDMSAYKDARKVPFTFPEQDVSFVKQKASEGMQYKDIAKEMNRSPTYVTRIMKEHGQAQQSEWTTLPDGTMVRTSTSK